jgi:hypothetical protein
VKTPMFGLDALIVPFIVVLERTMRD